MLYPVALKSPQASVSSFAKQNPFLQEAGVEALFTLLRWVLGAVPSAGSHTLSFPPSCLLLAHWNRGTRGPGTASVCVAVLL